MQSVDEKGNIVEFDRYNNIVFYYDVDRDMVSITYDYYMKILDYGIKTGGFSTR